MRINTAKGKTEFIHNNRRTEGFDVCTGNVTMNLTSSYKNFGVMVDEGNNQETEIGARIEKYIKNFRLMHPLLKEKYVPREVKTNHIEDDPETNTNVWDRVLVFNKEDRVNGSGSRIEGSKNYWKCN